MVDKRVVVLGRLLEVPLYLHLSCPLFLLLGALLALEPLAAYSGRSPVQALPPALALLALLALSNLLHEVGHLAVAGHHHLRIHSICLYPFGGTVRLSAMPVSSGPFTQMILGGPLTSLALAGAGFFAWWLWPHPVLLWVGQYNLLLGLVNLLPAPPLDSSRLLDLLPQHAEIPEQRTAVSFMATLVLLLILLLSGGVALLTGLLLAQPAQLVGGLLLLATGCLILCVPAQPPVIYRASEHALWLRQTSVAGLLERGWDSATYKAWPTITPTVTGMSEESGLQPPLAPWIIHPQASLHEALNKLDATSAASLLVVVNGRVVDTLNRRQIFQSLQQHRNNHTLAVDPFTLSKFD